MYLWKLKTGQKGEKRKKKKENVSVQIEDLPLYLTLYSWHADLAFWSGGEMPSSLTWANKKLIVSCICFLVEFRELTDAELVRHRTWYWQKLKKKKNNQTWLSLVCPTSVRVNNPQRKEEISDDEPQYPLLFTRPSEAILNGAQKMPWHLPRNTES